MKTQLYPLAFFIVVAVLFGAQGVYGSQDIEKSLELSFQGIEEDLSAISDSAASLLEQKEGEFREQLEIKSKELNAKVDEMEEKLQNMSDKSGEKLEKYAEMLREKNAEMTEKAKTNLAKAKQEFSKKLDDTMSGIKNDMGALKEKAKTMSD